MPSRLAGHVLLILLSLCVTATATFTPVRIAVDSALENFSLEQAATSDAAFVRPVDVATLTEIPQLDPATVERMRPRASVLAHVVVTGDTVNKLAARYKVTAETIVWANNLKDADRLPVGQAILILPVSGVLHVVRYGETIASIAAEYRTDLRAIAEINGIAGGMQLTVGEQLVIPGARPKEVERPQASVRAVERTEAEERPASGAPARTEPVAPGGAPPKPVAEPEAVAPAPAAPAPAGPVAAGPAVAAPAPAAPVVAVPAPAAPQPLRPITYEVAPGDSVRSIAGHFGISTGTIVQTNGLSATAADSLQVGQKLVILPVDGLLHKVEAGDTVRELAGRYSSETMEIIEANALAEPFVLVPGTEIVIPGGRLPAPPAPPVVEEPVQVSVEAAPPAPAIAEEPVQAPVEAAPPKPAPPPEPAPLVYVVEFGDSLVTIAERHGVEARTVAQYNGLERSDLIAPGQKLMIPGGTPPRAPAAGAAAPRQAAARPAPPEVEAPKPQGPIEAAAAFVRPIVQAVPAPQPAPPPKPVVAANNWGIVEVASKFLGYAYVWGGHSPRPGFDCTGFTWYVYGQTGRKIPMHDLWGQMQAGPSISRSNLQAGDLVFFANTYMPGLSHVGIYIGGGRFIHAGSERTGVTVTSLSDAYWAPRYYGASRPW